LALLLPFPREVRLIEKFRQLEAAQTEASMGDTAGQFHPRQTILTEQVTSSQKWPAPGVGCQVAVKTL